jgi:chromosome segregation ATPase
MNTIRVSLSVAVMSAMLAFSACDMNSGEGYEKIQQENTDLKAKIQKDSAYLVQMNSDMQELYANLDSMRAREERIRQAASQMQGGKFSGEGGLNIDNAFKEMERLNAENQQKIANLQAKLKKSGNQNAALTQMVDELKKQIEDKERQITDLQSTVAALQGELDQVKQNLASTTAEKEVETTKRVETENTLNSVFYAIGKRKDLEGRGVISSKGLFKKNKDLSGSDESQFTKGDLRNMTEIEIGDYKAKRVELVEPRDASSYELVENGSTTVLKIKNPASFWRSRYLAIVVK